MDYSALEKLIHDNAIVLDIEFGSTKPIKLVSSLIESEKIEYLKPFGVHHSGSVLALWKLSSKLEPHPVVWLDSEGWPNSVIAKDFTGFLQLLPFSLGMIYDFTASVISSQEEPVVEDPKSSFEEDFFTEALSENQQNFADYSNFVAWLGENKLETCADPVAYISDSILANPKFENWLMT